MKHYTLISTYPENRASANVGDLLIRESEKALIERERGGVAFTTYFREDSLDDYLDEINRTDGILMTFPIRDTPMYPGTFRLVNNLADIRVPIIPMPANWNVYPGDAMSREHVSYSSATREFLHAIASNVSVLPCREYHTMRVLARHGIHNTVMTGDPSWYDPAYFGKPMHRPGKIERLVFSPPLSPFYVTQAKSVMAMLAELYPQAERVCSMHLADSRINLFANKRPSNDASMTEAVAEKNTRIRRYASEYGFEVREVAGDVRKIEFYKACDLHVGYECHAHVSFLRWRRPSVLIAEDARGVGFNYTFGVGGFDGFRRCQNDSPIRSLEGGTSGYCVTVDEYSIAPCDHSVVMQMRQYLAEEASSRFRRYQGVAEFIDETYEQAMAPFLRSLP
ncbi:polysaccharide pyruvyl transferase family protein [Paenibacillus oceani]|uniref:Polysaccharide pyruvyl transferase family protein n=1 Tax=Paenibacillus oceani TaxID=2772510 RepID=A0A927CB06_9BACL|nr:polysaccharide pyruvyl transferase family protein [Paenibacillus oceani]MBD2864360.1 polysaccharide pyruvyl transferase family protein [Paenibacillus oceani]